MAKTKKTEEVQSEETVIVDATEQNDTIVDENTSSASEAIVEPTPESVPVEEVTESGEILFLRRILNIQHNGGFGRHLDDIIYERIKSLKCQ